jgi:hypothetical protein
MGCGGSTEATEAKEVATTTVEAAPSPPPQELYKTAVDAPLPKGHEALVALVDLLNEHGAGGGVSIAAWLKEVDETRARRKAIEEACGSKPFAEFTKWVIVVESVFAAEVISVANLEKAWGVQRTNTAVQTHVATGAVRALSDEEAQQYRGECSVPDGLHIDEYYKRATTPPLPKGHERLEALITVLKEKSAGVTYGWLKEIDETRSRRKAIEADSGGMPFPSFRVWVAIVEDQLAEEVVSIANLEKAWAVGKYAKTKDEGRI